MINERLRKRLRKDRPATTITLQIPIDVLESLKAIAPTHGLRSYDTLLKSYIGDGLRRDEAEIGLKKTRKLRKETRDTNCHIGSSLDAFLREEGIYEDTQYNAIRHALASHITRAMKAEKLTKVQMCNRMRTSPAQLERLLDPDKESVTLATLHRAARVLGRKLSVNLV